MRNYQKWSSDLIQQNPFLLLVLPVGGGKTISVLDAVNELIKKRKSKRILIIAPLRVAEQVWPDEIEKWMHLSRLRYSVITGSERGRMFALGASAHVYIINRENVQWLWKTMKRLRIPMFDTVIIDESTMLQEGKKRTILTNMLSRFGAVINFCKYADRVIELTGTVSPHGLSSLWGQVYALDFGDRLGKTKEDFLKRWFHLSQYGRAESPRKGAFEEILDKVSDIVIAPDISEHIKKIPCLPTERYVDLSATEMKRYKELQRTMYEEVTDVEAITSGVLVNKLLQLANGSLYRERGKDIPIHNHKLQALEEIVEELNGENILVAYSYQFDLDRIRKKYPKAVVLSEDPNAYADWNKGKIKMMLAHPLSAGHGLNLQFGGHHAVWYGLTWSLEAYLQFNGRLPRTGQNSDYVFLHHILARGTVDERVYAKMATGATTQDEITRAVQRQLDREVYV